MEKEILILSKIRDNKENEYNNIIIENYTYCLPYIGSIYASMFIAESIGAHCLFDDQTFTFLKYKAHLDSQRADLKDISVIYNELFSFMLPNEIKPPLYAITDKEKCDHCTRIKKCNVEYEKQTKEYINKILSIRNYDELYQLRDEIERIIGQFIICGEDITSNAVKEELQMRQQKINSLIHRRFEQIKRWSKFASVCSVPATIISAASANMPATIITASLLGLSQAADGVMDFYESKKKWEGFLHFDQ